MAVIFVLYSNVMRWVKITTGKPGIHQGAILSAVVSQRDKTYVMFSQGGNYRRTPVALPSHSRCTTVALPSYYRRTPVSMQSTV